MLVILGEFITIGKLKSNEINPKLFVGEEGFMSWVPIFSSLTQ
jgi:hypothetical protein